MNIFTKWAIAFLLTLVSCIATLTFIYMMYNVWDLIDIKIGLAIIFFSLMVWIIKVNVVDNKLDI